MNYLNDDDGPMSSPNLIQFGLFVCYFSFFIVTDVTTASAAFLSLSYCFYYLCTVSVLGKLFIHSFIHLFIHFVFSHLVFTAQH